MSLSGPFLFDPRAFWGDEDVKLLSWSQIAVYVALLSHQWEEGDIPEDRRRARAAIAGGEREKVPDADLDAVFPFFGPIAGEPGRLRNERLHEEREAWKTKKAARSAAGKASGAARRRASAEQTGTPAEQKPNTCSAGVQQMPNRSSSSSSSSSAATSGEEFGGDPPDLAPEAEPKKRRTKKDEELDWRIIRVHERLCARRRAVLDYLQGSAPGAPPALHPKLRKQIRTALIEFDADMLGPEDRERWERDSRVAAAGEGLWMNTWNNGSAPENKEGRRYVEPARAFTQFRKEGPHGVEQHSETFFRKRARDEARARANRRHDDGLV